jgi:ATP synthase I chain
MSRDLRYSVGWVAAAGGVLSLGMLFFFGLRAGFSTAVGAAVACANLLVLARVVAAMLGRGTSVRAWRAVGVIKMVALIVAVWALLTTGLVDPIPLVVGLGALPLGLATGSMLGSGRGKEAPEDTTDDQGP